MFADHEARATLGAILLTGQRALEPVQAEAGLQPHHFYKPSHQHIYAAAVHLADQGDGIDQLTIASELRRRGQLDTVGEDIVDALLADAPVASNVVTYARAVVEAARWRARDDLHRRALTAVEAGDEAAYNAASAVTAEPDRGQAYTADMLAAGWEAELTGPSNRIPLPWTALTNGFNGGVMPGDTTILAAHSSHGKSLVASMMLEHVGKLGGRVALYTNETTVPDLRDRLLAGMTSVPFGRIQTKDLSAGQHAEIRKALREIPVVLIPAFGWGWQDIVRHVRRSKWDLACLDLFQRLPGRDRTSDVDAAISGLCNGAAQADTHLIVCAQLNQERSKSDVRPVPTGRDLRESGAMYNDPANVVFLHQEQDVDPESGVVTRTGRGQVWIDKARNGRPGARVEVSLNPYRMRFEEPHEWKKRPSLEAVAA